MSARIKLLLQYKKWMLIHLAKRYSLPDEGTKSQLAERIAEFEEADSGRIWDAISNGGAA